MILYLLVPVLILGVVDSQRASMTTALWTEEMQEVDRNQTLSISTLVNSTVKPSNVTSGLYKDEDRQIEDLVKSNTTSILTEDNEDFQDQQDKLSHHHCLLHNMTVYSEILCVHPFHLIMREISPENWCVTEDIIRDYHDMTACIETVSAIFDCFYPNQASQDLFVDIHSTYFQNCSKNEVLVEAPQWLVITLTLIPVNLIPVLTYLVVIKSKVQE